MEIARNFISKNNKRYWLVKFAPFRTSWTDIVHRGTFTLRCVRSRQARNFLAAMQSGDLTFFYHSQQELAVVWLMEVSREAYPDPTSSDPHWLTCDFRPLQTFPHPITLAAIKASPDLTELPLVRQPRLAVMPVTSEEFEKILAIGLQKG